MILVSVGTHNQPFDRLVRKMDELAPGLGDKVLIQRGYSNYLPKNAESFDFVEGERWTSLLEEARLIVCHGGATTLMNVVRMGKSAVVVPRRRHLREHIYDREGELAEALAERGLVSVVYDVEMLEAALRIPPPRRERFESSRLELIERMRAYMDSLAKLPKERQQPHGHDTHGSAGSEIPDCLKQRRAGA